MITDTHGSHLVISHECWLEVEVVGRLYGSSLSTGIVWCVRLVWLSVVIWSFGVI
jgi:hypothetical protein